MRRINYIKLGVGLMIAFVATFYFCSKRTSISPPTDDQQNSFLTAATWKVTLIERGSAYNINIEDFAGYQFVFNSNAMVNARKGSESFTGTWNMSSSPSGQRQLYIGFKDVFPVNACNNKWTVMELSADKLLLQYAASDPVGPGNDPSVDKEVPSGERPYLMKLYFEAIPSTNPN